MYDDECTGFEEAQDTSLYLCVNHSLALASVAA